MLDSIRIGVVITACPMCISAAVDAQQSNMDWGYRDLPAARDYAKNVGLLGAAKAGNQPLGDAVNDGTVTIYPGQPPPGTYACSWQQEDGTWGICVLQGVDNEFFSSGMVHEWSHNGLPLTAMVESNTGEGRACVGNRG